MSIKDESLIEYVLGLTTPSERRMIQKQMEDSRDIRDRVAQIRDTLAETAHIAEPVIPSDALSTRIEKSIAEAHRFEGFIDRLTVFLDSPAERVRKLLHNLDARFHELSETGLSGVRAKRFKGGPRLKTSECALMWMEPGAAFPAHRHLGHEWGFVLEGEAIQDDGKIYRAGDIVHQTPQSRHSFTASERGPFVFFVVHNGIDFE